MLRNDQTDTTLAKSIDEALMRSLSEHARFESTYFSPTPFPEIELAAGCRKHTNECVSRIATSLSADWLLVRELKRDARGALVLSLVAQDGAAAKARHSEARISELDEAGPDGVVDGLVAELYGQAAVSRTAPPEDSALTNDGGRRPLRIAGFSVLAASGAVLAVGIAEGARGKNEHDRYRNVAVTDDTSAQLAHEYLDSAQKHTRVANGLFAAGAVAATTGIALLVWDRVRRNHDDKARLALGIHASPQGGLVSLAGPLSRQP